MNITEAIEAFFNTQAGMLALWVAIAAVVDFGSGTLAAIRDGTFSADSWAAWGRKHIAGRVFPAWGLLFVGQFASAWVVPGTDIGVFTTFGLVFAGTYIVETFASVMDSWGSQSPTAPGFLRRDETQPVPED